MTDFLYIYNLSPIGVLLVFTVFFMFKYFDNKDKPSIKVVIVEILIMAAIIYAINAIFVIARMVLG